MAEIKWLELNASNIIVGVHSHEIPAGLLPEGYSCVQETVEQPSSLLGLNISEIDTIPKDRPLLFDLTLAEKYRNQLRVLSIELDLMARLDEDTTAKQAEFDALKTLYEALP